VTPFEVAVARRQWSLVALYLLLAISETARTLPPQSLDALIGLLAAENEGEQS
jgi:hypothetical protein